MMLHRVVSRRRKPGSGRFMQPTPIAEAGQSLRRMFIRNLVLPASIGVHAHEHAARQRVRINLDLAIRDDHPEGAGADELSRVVDYETLLNRVRGLVASGHVRLAETLAERLAFLCLADARVVSARVRVEKLDLFPDAESAGVEVERRRV